MELTLNLAWVVLTALMIWLWMRHAPRKGANRPTQFVAIAVVALILFTVISMTDDLVAAQNPAETDSCLRKVHSCLDAQLTQNTALALPGPDFVLASIGFAPSAVLVNLPAPRAKFPPMASVRRRPPPIA